METIMNKQHTNNLLHPTLVSFSFSLIQKLAKILTNTISFGVYIEPIIQLVSPNWKIDRISAKITAVRHESANIYTLVLKPSSKWNTYEAGQFIQLSSEIKGSLITRTFSISSEPVYFKTSGKIELTIRSQDQGLLTPWLRTSAQPGDTVYLSQASGDFKLQNKKPNKLFIAAGSGITAIRPILKQYKNEAWFKDAQLLFYVNNRRECLFLEDLNELENCGLTYKYIYSEESGRICQQHLSDFCDDLSDREVYLCGPPKMIETTNELLKANKVPESNIFFEYFGPPPLKSNDFELDDSEEFIQVDYLSSKKQVSFKADSTPKTLLDIAESEGINPVSGCRTGVCHQCICKKKQGRVFNIKTKQYSDSGSEEIQLCLSVPVGHIELEL